MKLLEKALENLEIIGINEKLNLFKEYRKRILEWNEKVNLTAITEEEEFERKHYVDSILLAESQEFREAKKVVDVGTGAGFPAVPLAILFPDKKFTLLDSSNKRLKIVKEICQELAIKNVDILHGRAEDIGKNKKYREQFDLCLSRAVANMSTLSEYCLPLVKLNGYFIAYKGKDCQKEIDASEKAIKTLGGDLIKIDIPNMGRKLPNYGLNHELVYIKKVLKTLENYPRQAGTPNRSPL